MLRVPSGERVESAPHCDVASYNRCYVAPCHHVLPATNLDHFIQVHAYLLIALAHSSPIWCRLQNVTSHLRKKVRGGTTFTKSSLA